MIRAKILLKDLVKLLLPNNSTKLKPTIFLVITMKLLVPPN